MNVLLGLTGSVASSVAPKLVQALQASGHEVQVVATQASFYFFHEQNLGGVRVWRDKDEWPAMGYRKGQPIPHIDLGKWADVFLVAPLSANTLGKFSNGLCDNLLTCVFRAWDCRKRIIVAPAMNTNMWNHPLTLMQLKRLTEVVDRLTLVEPVVKTLACGDTGIGAMADVDTIIGTIR